ncbi:MAG: LmeA family phospholipid-binding protein, partial [Cyanobacteria bacterium J06555_13]
MLGGLLGSQSSSTDFGENMLSSVARQAIAQLFTRSESVDVSVRCSPSSKILQGIVDSFKMKGKGLVIKKMFEAEEMEFETDAVSLDMSGLPASNGFFHPSAQTYLKK